MRSSRTHCRQASVEDALEWRCQDEEKKVFWIETRGFTLSYS